MMKLVPPRSDKALADRISAGGRRLTPQRVLVARALADARRALSAQELYERLRASHPRLGRATVFRALEAQVQDGMARRLERSGHVSVYVACDGEHHHHLVCERCERVEDLDEKLLQPLLRSVDSRYDFQVDHTALDIYGLCASCRRAARRAAG